MNFNYPHLTAAPFKGMRFYETPEGKFYPSITTVLGGTMPAEKQLALKNWQTSLGMDVAQKKTKDAADHGTAVHLLTERYLKKEPLQQAGENIKFEDMAAFNALKLKLKKIEEIWGQEVALYSDILGVAGRTDLIGVYKGKPSIIDFKTSGRIKSEKDIEDYRLQLCAYAIMHNEMFNTDIQDGVILMTSAGGFPQEFNVDLSQYVEKLARRVDEFYAEHVSKII
jgi:CRISPR/Cas system-associated exonuclease Cas4 (RecB family)